MDDSETIAGTHGGTAETRPRGVGPLAPGAPFGTRYRVLKVLGAGGMGVVYQAWDQELGVAVALKVIRPEVTDDPHAAREVERRFKQELLLARQVTHKNVIRIHDLGEIDGIKYLTMPCLEGQDLASVLRQAGRLPPARALAIARQIAAGLVAAHDVGVVHRDLKPENVMIGPDDSAVIMDFGISRSLTATGTRTALGAVMGTLEYMAPEQGQGQAVDHRADIYSFGLILYDMLVGRRRPTNSESAVGELMQRIKQAPAPVRSIDPSIPDGLDRIISRCLDPDPGNRYATTSELAGELQALDADGRAQMVPSRKSPRRVPAAPAAVVLLLVAGAAFFFWPESGGEQPAPADQEPISVLVTDFTNHAGDPVFEGAVEQALTIALEGASFITAYPRASAMRLVQSLNLGARLDESAGRLVSQREGIKVILAGGIAAAGDGYEISVRALEPTLDERQNQDQTLLTVSRTASSKNDVLGAVSQLAADIRRRLGDTHVDDLDRATETFTSTDLEAAREYALAQRLAEEGKDEQAIVHYQRATERDKAFGRAYSGWATSAMKLGQKAEAKRLYDEAIRFTDRMTEREKYRTLGAYHIAINNDFEKGIENYTALVRKYPADGAGHNNLAVAHFSTLNFQKALDEGRKLIEIYPRSVLYRYNYALYAMYAGDFKTAAEQANEAIKLNPATPKAYLALAMAAFAGGDRAGARAAYERAQAAGDARGASLASIGLADLAMFEGRYADAIGILEQGISADEAARNPAGAAAKRIALAEARFEAGQQTAALAAVDAALAGSTSASVLVPAAHILIEAGRESRAKALAADLGARLQPHDRAYGRMIEGQIAAKNGRVNDALLALREARKLANLWLVQYHMALAEVQAGDTHYAAALQDLESCQARRGEATAVFLDDVPSFRYMAPVQYWLARAQEGTDNAVGASQSLRTFLSYRADAASDRLTTDARRRLSR